MARGIMEAMATTTLMSFAEFERLDGGPDHLELLKGELLRVPPPYAYHMEIVERLYEALKAAVESRRSEQNLGKVHMEMGYLLSTEPPSWLRPDVSLTFPQQSRDRFYAGAPCIAFEVVSHHDKAKDLNIKVSEYLANGAQEIWLIYSDTRQATVFGPAEAVRTEHAIRTPLLPGLDIRLEQIL
jgi:Uma2 family endonuclease